MVLLASVLSIGCDSHVPVGVELTYVVDTDDAPAKKIDMQKMLTAVRRRVGRFGTAGLVADQIKVGVYGDDRKNVARIKRLVAHAGVLEFRILADRRFDSDVIDVATLEEFVGKRDIRETSTDEFPAAQWLLIADESEGRQMSSSQNLATRRSSATTVEALVVIDPYHVTGADFGIVSPATDRFGKPCVSFELTAEGAKRMNRFTSGNLPPDDDPEKRRRLAIILDGRIQTAPYVITAVGARGVITGNFSEQEVADLSVILSAGSLPAHLKLMDEKTVTAGGK